jgi:hypothetical protein
MLVWHTGQGSQVWRLGAVTPSVIPYQRVFDIYQAYPAGMVYVVVYGDIDRVTGEVHYRGENEAASHPAGTCEKAGPKRPGNPKF